MSVDCTSPVEGYSTPFSTNSGTVHAENETHEIVVDLLHWACVTLLVKQSIFLDTGAYQLVLEFGCFLIL